MFLAIYDLSGIQSFIFATNKLKEMIGGSSLVSKALADNIPKLLGEEKNYWETSDFKFSDGDSAKTVYIGGGNAVVAFPSEEEYRKVTRKLQKDIFLQTGGALKLCSACIESDKSKHLAVVQKDLMDMLDRQKKTSPTASTAKSFSINAHDNETFDTMILVEDGYFFSKQRYLKRNAPLNNDKKIFITELESFFDQAEKRTVAVIHIDGNTMGIRIRDFVNNLDEKQGLISHLNSMRELSIDISKVYSDALKETEDEMFPDFKGAIPFRPVVSDGDDITVICKCNDAFEFVKKFTEKLKNKEVTDFGNNSKLSAGAGIAFVNVGFPFCTAYDMAEQLCRNAKKKVLEHHEHNKSSVDFQVCIGGITTDVQEYRNRNYAFELKRPYVFDAMDKSIDFEKAFWGQKDTILNSGIARSKLKGLRNEYGKGTQAAKTYGDFLKAKMGDDESVNKALNILSEPFEDNIASYFDILDVMDLLDKGDKLQ